jgi:hypothetical protein
MTWGVANPLMLAGLLGLAIPVLIHFLNRRRTTVVDWGAMMFLDLGRRARRKVELTDLMLMAGRMLLLGLLAIALARPFWAPRATAGPGKAAAAGGLLGGGAPRDVVLVIDGSRSTGRRAGEATARDRALAWARDFVAGLPPGSAVGLLLARDRVTPLVDGLSPDGARVRAALADAAVPPPHGTSDLAAGLAEALRLLESGRHGTRDVVLLTDGRRQAWRVGEPARWALLRDLHRESRRRTGVEPGLWALAPGEAAPAAPAGADGAVTAIDLPRALVPPGRSLEVRATIRNGGPGPLTRTAELLVDGVPAPGSAQAVGPLPPGGATTAVFVATPGAPGGHALGVRLAPDDATDPLPGNDAQARAVEVVPAVPVLLVDGEPGLEPLSGETDFLRAALAPRDDDAPPVAATVVPLARFEPAALERQRVLVLANVDRLSAAQAAGVAAFLAAGGGVLVAPGDRIDATTLNATLHRDGAGWLPAAIGAARGDAARRKAVARPAPASFVGPLAPLAKGEAPALGEAELFGYRVLKPATRPPAAVVLARLDTGDPWVVERPNGDGRAILLAGPVDAEGGTLPVNPDFVPLAHELVLHLADPSAASRRVRPGEPLVVPLDPPPPEAVESLAVTTPTGAVLRAAVVRHGSRARATLDLAAEPGLYRFTLPGGTFRYAEVAADPTEDDPAPLADADITRLADGWPLVIERDPAGLAPRLLAAARPGPRPLWRLLVLAALAGLCVEVVATRRLIRRRGLADA